MFRHRRHLILPVDESDPPARIPNYRKDVTVPYEKEKRSGTTRARPKFQECLEYVREGDTLVVTRLDRLDVKLLKHWNAKGLS